MFKMSKKSITIIIIVACIAVVYGFKFYQSAKGNLSSGSDAKIKGDPNAPVRVVEFIDFQCPACAQGANYLKELMMEHPKLIRLELKHFPLAMHQHGVLSSQYAECAAMQGKFWPFQDLILARQNNWSRLMDANPAFVQAAKEAGLDLEELLVCLEEGKADKVIEKNKAEGVSLNIRSTPTYFVNGKMVVGKKSLEDEVNKYKNENAN